MATQLTLGRDMYESILAALEEIRSRARMQSNLLGMTHRGLPFSPVADPSAHPALATLYIINAVSALDDALEHCIDRCAPSAQRKKADNLGKRINLLEALLALSNATLLRQLKDRRNELAHEVGCYASWQELWTVLDAIEHEIEHLRKSAS